MILETARIIDETLKKKKRKEKYNVRLMLVRESMSLKTNWDEKRTK